MSEQSFDSQVILETANRLFNESGFEQTSLQSIADKVKIPVTVLEQEYTCKEQIALKIYHEMAKLSHSELGNLPDGTISERYFTVIEGKLVQLNAHQEAVSALFATAMRPSSSITAADISPGLRDPMMLVMQELIASASDKPSRDEEELALFLYTFHFLVIVFWLYDRTKNKEASHMFTTFLREFVRMVRPMMVMPMVTKAFSKVSKIMMVIFGGARLVDAPTPTRD